MKNGIIFGMAILLSFALVSSVCAAEAYSTCVKRCAEYPASECDVKCGESCVPTTVSKVAECKKGICFDRTEGTCQRNAPKKLCEDKKGVWSADPNVQQCKPGCCILGEEAVLTTDARCAKMSSWLGMQKDYKPNINTFIECSAYSNTRQEGACLLSEDFATGKHGCKFVKKEECTKLKGEFYGGFLCSHPDLNTTCIRQKASSCVEGKEEVYWFDSCGNRENIYDSNRERSWNNGKVLTKNESCALGAGSNPFANQGTCGNCDYLTGSKCGNRTDTQKMMDSSQKNVCRDLSCKDESGKKRKHGETWCAYQGNIGEDDDRGVDTVGSRHFRRVCFEGEVRLEPCADYRNEICIEEPKAGAAGCIPNLWQNCIKANNEDNVGRADSCKEYSDYCFMKSVAVADYFEFGVCTPKYPPGYKMNGNGKDSCDIATKKCVVSYVKDDFSLQWECKSNCDCRKGSEFATKMNDLCMSLGDCGAEANYIGVVTSNYEVEKSDKPLSSYLDELKKYAKTIPGKYATAEKTLQAIKPRACDTVNAFAKQATTWASPAGLLISRAHDEGEESACAMNCVNCDSRDLSHLEPEYSNYGEMVGKMHCCPLKMISSVAVAYLGESGSNFFVQLHDWLSPSTWFGGGKVREKKVKFTCERWQPPSGGRDCERCGKDGFPCTEYACGSLGKACKLINKDTGSERCIDMSPTRVEAPRITPWAGVLEEGFKFGAVTDTGVSFESNDADGCLQGGLGENAAVTIGLTTDIPSTCRYSFTPKFDYKAQEEKAEESAREATISNDTLKESYKDEAELDAEQDSGGRFGSNIITENHSRAFVIPSMESLGSTSHDPNARAEYNIYVKCESANGIVNTADYVVKMCVKRGIDVKWPNIAAINPPSDLARYDEIERDVSIYTDEPADCKWSTADNEYEFMIENFTCDNQPEAKTNIGWRCNATLPLKEDKSVFYVRCLDQPWEENGSKRNAMPASYEIVINKTEKLAIKSVEPDGKVLVFGIEPASVSLYADTSGGDEQTTNCYYSFDGEAYHPFFAKEGNNHSTTFDTTFSGDYKIWVRCTDAPGNADERQIYFSVNLDVIEPKVSRIYQQKGNLVVKTDENAECAVSGEKCNFVFENGTLMLGGGQEHRTPATGYPVYYLQCRDTFGNRIGQCDMVLRTV